jgi:hypothetical protein
MLHIMTAHQYQEDNIGGISNVTNVQGSQTLHLTR